MADLFMLAMIVVATIVAVRIQVLSRIDYQALEMISKANSRWLEETWKDIRASDTRRWGKAEEDEFYRRLALMERLDGLNWRSVFDLTRWTLRQRYPWIVELSKEG